MKMTLTSNCICNFYHSLEESNRVLLEKVESLDALHKVKVEEMFKLSRKLNLAKEEYYNIITNKGINLSRI